MSENNEATQGAEASQPTNTGATEQSAQPTQPTQESPTNLKQESPKAEHNPSTKQEVGDKSKPATAPKEEGGAAKQADDKSESGSKETEEEMPSAEELGWDTSSSEFRTEVELFASLGIDANLLSEAMDNGVLDVSKLGSLSTRDAAVVKATAENMYRAQYQKGMDIRKSYEDLVGGPDHYAAMISWVNEQKAAQPEGDIASMMNEVSDLLKSGGAAARSVVTDLYSRFRKAEGTAVNARIARAGEQASETPAQDFDSRRERLQKALQRHGGGHVSKAPASDRLTRLRNLNK